MLNKDKAWITCSVAEIAAPTKNALVGRPFGSNLVSRDYVSSGVPVIRGKNIDKGRWVKGEFVYISHEKANELSANIARPGDLIFAQSGTLGQIAIVPEHYFDHYIISQSQVKLTVDPSKADALFLYYYFSSKKQKEYMSRRVAQTIVPHTNLEHLRTTSLRLPPLSDQKAIAYILGKLDDKIELNQRMNDTLATMSQALFKSWFVNFDPVYAKTHGHPQSLIDVDIADRFPDSFENLQNKSIPKGWKVIPIGEAVHVFSGATPSTTNPKFWEGGTINWVTPKDLASLPSSALFDTERCITELGLHQISSGLLPKGTVLLSSRSPIGYLAIAEIPLAINQSFIAMVCDRGLSNHYVLQWARANMDTIRGYAHGITLLEISKRNFRSIPIIVPPQPLLQNFNEQAIAIHQQIVNNLRQSQTLAGIREVLLPRLLSGEIQVKDTEKLLEDFT